MERALTSVNVAGIASVKEAVPALRTALRELRDIAAEADLGDPDQAEQFKRNIRYLKSYYERIEVLLRHATQ